jgi:hypothetical protein
MKELTDFLDKHGLAGADKVTVSCGGSHIEVKAIDLRIAASASKPLGDYKANFEQIAWFASEGGTATILNGVSTLASVIGMFCAQIPQWNEDDEESLMNCIREARDANIVALKQHGFIK